MRFLQFIQEAPMNAKAFAGVEKRLGTIAKVGFEFEMIIPQSSDLFDKTIATRGESQVISYYDSLEEFDEVFTITKQQHKSIITDFGNWQEEQLENGTDEDEVQFHNWLKDQFRNKWAFVQYYYLEPKYGWYESSGRYAAVFTEPLRGALDGTANLMRNSLDKILSEPVVVVQEYHGERKDGTSWYIEPDSSVGNGEDNGLELVSPPMPLSSGLKTVEKIFNWMKDEGLETDSTTGLHINISIPNIAEKLDPLKLVLFMGEHYALDQFGRISNDYTKPQIDVILGKIKASGKLPQSAAELTSKSWELLSTDKHHSVNFKNLKSGYLEFRVAGNAGYEQNLDKAKKTIYRFVTAVEIACDLTSWRQEYLKKLSIMFGKADAAIQAEKPLGDFSPEMARLVKYNSKIIQWENSFNQVEADEKKQALLGFIEAAIYTVKDFKTTLDLKERVFFKKKIKDVGLTASDADAFFGHDHLARLRFRKEIGL